MTTTVAPATITIAGQTFTTRTSNGVLQVLDACGKCFGRGEVGYGNYIYNGHRTCWTCNGSMGTWMTYDAMVKKLADRAKRAAAAERKQAAKVAAAQVAYDAAMAAMAPAVAEALRTADRGILADFNLKVRQYGSLTERQMELAEKIVRENAERAVAYAARNEAAAVAGHFGTVGERVTVDVEVTNVREFDGDYGTRYLVTMTTAEGHVLNTWNTGAFGRNAEKGDKVTIKATIKKHGDYKGTPQTELTRVAAA